MALTQKQELFVNHYLAGESATEACRLAGYTDNYDSLRVIASQNLTNVHIRQRIASKLKESGMAAQEVLSKMGAIARGDAADFVKFDADGRPQIDLEQAKNRGSLHLIKRISIAKNGKISLELYSKYDALVSLMRHYSLFHDSMEITSYREEISILIASGLVTVEDLRNEYPEIATEILDAIR